MSSDHCRALEGNQTRANRFGKRRASFAFNRRAVFELCIHRSNALLIVDLAPHIRAATPADAGLLAALAERTFRDAFADDNSVQDMETYVRESFSLDRVRTELADDANTFLLAFVDDPERPAGYAKLRTGTPDRSVIGPDPVELQRLYLDRSAIGRGIGAALMRASLEMARSAGHRTLWLGVWERNAQAISFYEKWQFETVGHHVFRLGSDVQRDLIMERPVWGAV